MRFIPIPYFRILSLEEIILRLTDEVEVHDDWLSEPLRNKLIETTNWLPMYFINRATRFETHPLDIHWYYPIAMTEEAVFGRVEDQLDVLEDPLNIIKDVWHVITQKIGGNLGLYECSVSGNTFGTEGNPHFDMRNRAVAPAHYTVLIYCVQSWETAWAGETLFFDDEEEITGGVMPKPGRVAVVRGDPHHVGRSVSRICPIDRRVLVFKFWDEEMLKTLLEHSRR